MRRSDGARDTVPIGADERGCAANHYLRRVLGGDLITRV
jgi:hypothetical protein